MTAALGGAVLAPGQGMGAQADGFTLIETLIAAALLITLASGVGPIATLASRAVDNSGQRAVAMFLAVEKLEQLAFTTEAALAAPWSGPRSNLVLAPSTRDGRGLRPPSSIGGTGWAGEVDYLDLDGRWLGTGPAVSPGTAFARRWTMGALNLPGRGGDAVVLQVAVISMRGREGVEWGSVQPSDPGVTWVATARTQR